MRTPGAILLTIAAFLALAPPSQAATYTVVNTADSGVGSLRWAIQTANISSGADTIAFAIPGAGPHSIVPFTALPAIMDTVVIDGYTQSGAVANTNPMTLGINTVLQIELNGVMRLVPAWHRHLLSNSKNDAGLLSPSRLLRPATTP